MAYDIADPKRLARIHKRLKKEGVAAQKSVFFVRGTERRINRLMDALAELMDLAADDLRAYPITRPSDVWTNAGKPATDIPLVYFG